MAEELAAQAAEGAPATQSPAAEAKSEIETLRAEFEERIKGFQRLVSERDTRLSTLEKQLEERRLAELPEDERDALVRRQAAEEVQRLRAENELLRLEKQYGGVMDIYRELLNAPTAEDQLRMLASLREAREKVAEEPRASEPETPPTLSNNPMRPQTTGVVLEDGTVMNDEVAERILRSFGRMRTP